MGDVNRAATGDEIEKMRGLVRQAMGDGAFGLSSGLFYVPGTFTPTAEVVELAKVAGGLGGIYISHMRDEAAGVVDSVKETIAIGERGGLPTQVTHHKVVGTKNRGRSVDTLRLDRRSAGPRRRRDDRPLPLHGVEHVNRVGAAAGVGARGRRRRDPQAARRPGGKGQGSRRQRDHHPRRARRWRSEERRRRALRLGPGAERHGSRRHYRQARAAGDAGERRRNGDMDRRAGRRPGHLPRHQRGRPRTDPRSPARR